MKYIAKTSEQSKTLSDQNISKNQDGSFDNSMRSSVHSELKRGLKVQQKAGEKPEKVVLNIREGKNTKEEEMLPNASDLKNLPEIHSQPQKFPVSISLEDFVETYSSLKGGEMLEEVSLSVAGRIHAIRKSGVKLIFCDFRSVSVKLQVMADAKLYESEVGFATDTANLLRGDIIGINGYPGRTKMGELSVIPKKITQLYNLASLLPLNEVP